MGKKPKAVRYIYAMPRPEYGYNPGDVVSKKFAEEHPWAVRMTGGTAGEGEEADTLGPGEEVRVSGQYQVVDGKGRGVEGEGEYTLVEGEPAPPVPSKGLLFKLVDATKHGGAEQ